MDEQQLKNVIEAVLLAASEPLGIDKFVQLFPEENPPERDAIRAALQALSEECAGRGVELKEVGSGFRYQVRSEMAHWVSKLWEERPPRYSRALLETLALVAYRQPITRAEIEEIRGVSVSTQIMKTLQDRDWVRAVGHRDVPGKPAMYATTKAFLDYFNLRSLDELPTLAEIRDIDRINGELQLGELVDAAVETTAREGLSGMEDAGAGGLSDADERGVDGDVTHEAHGGPESLDADAGDEDIEQGSPVSVER